MEGELHIGGVEIAQVEEGVVEALKSVGVASDLGNAARGDRGAEGGGRAVRSGAVAEAEAGVEGGLLGVAAEIGIDVNDGGAAEALDAVVAAGAEALHEQSEVAVVGSHDAGVVEVGEVLLELTAAVAGAGALEEHVVGEDGDVAALGRALCVHEGELGVGVPGGPAVAVVHAAGEVLVGVVEGDASAGQPAVEAGLSGLGGDADADSGGEASGDGDGGGGRGLGSGDRRNQ